MNQHSSVSHECISLVSMVLGQLVYLDFSVAVLLGHPHVYNMSVDKIRFFLMMQRSVVKVAAPGVSTNMMFGRVTPRPTLPPTHSNRKGDT
jgi:hypothetical protein